jgi:hypothetical protein
MFASTIQAIDLKVAEIALAITSPHTNRNTFVSPYFNFLTPIVATAGEHNVLLNSGYGPNGSGSASVRDALP